MNNPSRRAVLASLPLLAGLAPALAETGPPVTLVVPFSAGGAADIAARTLVAQVPRHLPEPAPRFIIENRPGASGALGTRYVAQAPPDGRTLLLARVASSAILPAINSRTPYRWDEFTMLGLLDENPFVVCVRADAPWKTLGDLAGALRDDPGQLQFATTGPATLLDLGMRHLFATLGLPIDAGLAVPFAGGGEAVAALLDGDVQFIGNNLSDMMAAITSGKLRALVVGAAGRLPMLPDVPTAFEAEVEPLARVSGWNALFGPPGLPGEVVLAWTEALARLRQDRQWLAATRKVGSVPRLLDPIETLDYVRAQVALYGDLGRRLGLV